MCSRLPLAGLGLLAGLLIPVLALAADASPEEVLKQKGLKKLNEYFVLTEEAALGKKFRELGPLAKKATDTGKRAATADTKVAEKKLRILGYYQKRIELRAQLENARSADIHNRIISAMNGLVDRINLEEKSEQEEKDAKTARATALQASEQYIESLLKVRKLHDQAGEKYDRLATDAAVQKAIEDFNKDSPKEMKLGPSGAFALMDRNLKKLEGKVIMETIPLQAGSGNLWHVTVYLNGKHAQDMAIDTGASVVALPYKVAEAAGLTPSASAETVRLTLADGHVIEAKQVFATSVRFGKFTVENVECAVMPSNLPDADAMLGLTFLEHFNYKIDSAKGKLTMSQVEQPAEKPGRRPPTRPGRPGPRVKREPSE